MCISQFIDEEGELIINHPKFETEQDLRDLGFDTQDMSKDEISDLLKEEESYYW